VESLFAKLVLMLRRNPALGTAVAVVIAVVAAKLHVSLGHSTGFWDGPL
jgi:hypothetical protein